MKIYIATDHAGFEMKNKIVEYVTSLGYTVEDMGALVYDSQDDYPDFIAPLAEKVALDTDSRGIIFGGSGQGEAIVANRVSGIRAVVYYGGTLDIPRLAREHNNANVLSVGARFVSLEEIQQVVQIFLETEFIGEERHVRRITKIDK
ncbi:RpiB/LacA/LacB family sugar-phosphate isomerase [Candidatus Nomurabacteria bacterium]|nr:RpiB/LacA/LacB family sugar-phosphate isomerase [Candidatus Nomurabacteria bacterium]